LQRKLAGHKDILGMMIGAMNTNTRFKCEQIVQRALARADALHLTEIKTYLERNWVRDTSRWGMWARDHSALLLQVDSNNALESYHRDIKFDFQNEKATFFLAAEHLHKILQQKFAEEVRNQQDMRTKQIAEVATYPALRAYAYPFQLLIAKEIEEGFKLCTMAAELMPIEKHMPWCSCTFFRKYLLPCAHMFQLDLTAGGWFDDAIWQSFGESSLESGYDVYVRRELERVEEAPEDRVERIAGNRLHLEVEASLNQAVNAYWRIREGENQEQLEQYKALLDQVVAWVGI
jgi:hypothetical protein